MPTVPRDAAQEKAALRARFDAYRRGLDPEAYARRSGAIVTRAQALPEFEHARTVHLYWPLIRRGEVDTRALIFWLHAKKKQILLPVVLNFAGRPGAAPRLVHRRFEGEAALQENRWGLREPTGSETVPPEEIDLVVVPALGAGRNGHRIGHGFGYYDAFLRGLRVPAVCLVYAACLVEAVPAEAHDVPVSVIVTEHEVIRPSPARNLVPGTA